VIIVCGDFEKAANALWRWLAALTEKGGEWRSTPGIDAQTCLWRAGRHAKTHVSRKESEKKAGELWRNPNLA